MKAGNESRIFSRRKTKFSFTSQVAPDISPVREKPSDLFVLCRDKDGSATAIYGESKWDLNPYRLAVTKLAIINFDTGFDCDDLDLKQKLISQAKWILYILMYYHKGGSLGTLSSSSILGYYYLFVSIGRFCIGQLNNDLARGIDINDVLSNTAYLKAYARSVSDIQNTMKKLKGLLKNLDALDFSLLGFYVCPETDIKYSAKPHRQHPVIPLRIYCEYINQFGEILDLVYPHVESIKDLIVRMEDRFCGAYESTQQGALGKNTADLRPTMKALIKEYDLESLFYKDFPLRHITRQSFSTWLATVQYVCKVVLHIYTGMRDQETSRCMFDCVDKVSLNEPVIDDSGAILDESKMLSIVSTTTKFEGYKREDSWLAPIPALKAIKVAKAFDEGLAVLYGVEVSTMHLFSSPAIVRNRSKKLSATSFANTILTKEDSILYSPQFRIRKEDLYLLSETDPGRDFASEKKFSEGEIWPFSSHQCRRSLAFYAAANGVSEVAIQSQFKHAARQMSRYYRKGFENLLTLFGHKEDVDGSYALGKNHIAFEFQMAVPTGAVALLFEDVFSSDATLMGGAGSYMEKLRSHVASGQLAILDAKEETIKLAHKGETAYRPTLLGGCTKVGPCDDFLLGDATACLSCDGAVIRSDKLDRLIAVTEVEASGYDVDSVEYQITTQELSNLRLFKEKKNK